MGFCLTQKDVFLSRRRAKDITQWYSACQHMILPGMDTQYRERGENENGGHLGLTKLQVKSVALSYKFYKFFNIVIQSGGVTESLVLGFYSSRGPASNGCVKWRVGVCSGMRSWAWNIL